MNDITYDKLVDLYNRASIIGYEGIESVTSTDLDGVEYTTLFVYDGNKENINNIYICIPSGFKNDNNPGKYAENIQKAIESLEKKTILTLDQKRNINILYSSLNIYLYGGENVRYLNCVFMNIIAHTIDLTNFKSKGLVEMDSTFNSAYVGTIELGSLYTGKVTTFEACFYSSNIERVDLSKLDVSSAKVMYGMFHGALISEMSEFNLSKWRTTHVENYCSMFEDFEFHGIIDISNFTTKHVKDAATIDMFEGTNFNSARYRIRDAKLLEELNEAYNMFVRCEDESFFGDDQ